MRSIERISEFFIRIRVWVVLAIAILTGFFVYFGSHGEVRTIFKDLMPSDHPYIKVHQEFIFINPARHLLLVANGRLYAPARQQGFTRNRQRKLTFQHR